MIKAIAFDFGGVIEIKERNLFKEIAEFLHIDIKELNNVYFSFNHLSNTGKLSGDEVKELTFKKLGASDEEIAHIKNLAIEIHKTKKINFELIEIIKELKSKNYKIGLLSNNSVKLNEKLLNNNLTNIFDEIVISSEVGYQKPQPEIFKILAKKLGVDITELLFIDDTKRSLEGAEDIGYTPLLYTSNEKLKEDISKILEINL